VRPQGFGGLAAEVGLGMVLGQAFAKPRLSVPGRDAGFGGVASCAALQKLRAVDGGDGRGSRSRVGAAPDPVGPKTALAGPRAPACRRFPAADDLYNTPVLSGPRRSCAQVLDHTLR
jgi:hypothetical protein